MINEILWIVFLAATAVQLIYILFIFSRLAFFKIKNTEKSNLVNPEGVTVIVAAHNEKENLKKLIPILCSQDYPNYDVMVINDRSFDGTRVLLEKMMAQYPQLRTVTVKYTPDHVTSKKYALTLGIKVAKNDVLLLTDADCIPQTDQWIKLMTAPVREEGKTFALGYAPYEKDRGLLNQWIQFETIWTALLYFSFALWKAPFMGVGRNLCYRRGFFMEKKAFKDLWQIDCGDDDLFINKYANGKNTAVVITPDSITLSKPKSTWKNYFTQKKRHFHAGKYYRGKDKQKIGLYTFSHLLFWITGISLLIFLGLAEKWEHFAVILGIITVRSLMLTWVFTSARKKLQGIGKVYWPIFSDVIYLGYFWIIGTLGYRSKTVRWK
ncbi:glycosyltransferase [Belliella pelovolcani]|uniref:Glycosyltransferase, catalytic subunit of cellulose synthase and poly-beta-1,6-N-acetylglucosamine synthase n=1 Tax=Belliella pelovolcani TaxID=529505 RepID=A0A1N7M4R0_9BACT|nr:glycosyltransferase [Belliella pelovolcani]SIS81057.1 Glycosyltransferase, catalytic subunit of cellulose synthase and poly-beta-1,6-N-acetylglucosamine synthase [Belliella pelovolcani]